MNPFKHVKDRQVLDRKEEEAYYELALTEFRSGRIRGGLMAKAMAESGGDEQRARSIYIKHLAGALRDDDYLQKRAHETLLRSNQRTAAEHERAKQLEAKATAQKKSTRGSGKSDFWGNVGVVAALAAVLGWRLLNGHEANYEAPTRPPVVPNPTAVQRFAESTPYEQLIAKNPGLDSNSSHYHKPYADRVYAKAEALMNAGQSPTDALEAALLEVQQEDSRRATPRRQQVTERNRQQPTESKRPCEYKGVMTDDDYRACGIQPPRP